MLLLVLIISFISAENMQPGGGSAQSIPCCTEDEIQQRVYDECNEGFIKAEEQGRKEQQKEDQKFLMIILVLMFCAYLLHRRAKKLQVHDKEYLFKPPNIGTPSLRDSQPKSIIDRVEELEKQIKELKQNKELK